MQDSTIGRALTPVELSNARYLDALHAFRTSSHLRMEDEPAGGAGAGAGGDGGGAGQGGQGAGANQGPEMATDTNGRSLGYPKDTAVAAMKPAEQAAYWQHQAQKHEGRFKNLVGERSFDDTKKALDEHAEFKKQQQTPAEQALNDAREEGKKAGIAAANQASAKVIFEGALLANGVTAADTAELVKSLNVDAYIGDNGVNVADLTTFAQRFSSPGKGNSGQQQPRDFGAGRRTDTGQAARGAAGKAEAEKRFGTKKA